jgi:hypothetical protein
LKLRLGHHADNVTTHIGIILKQEENSTVAVQNKEPEEEIEYYANANADADADANADADADGDVEILLQNYGDDVDMEGIMDVQTGSHISKLSSTMSQSDMDCLPEDELDLLQSKMVINKNAIHIAVLQSPHTFTYYNT